MKSKLSAALALVAVTSSLAGGMALCSVVPAQADIIFDLSPTDFTTTRGFDSGLGQGVSVSQTVTIDGFQFFANLPNGGKSLSIASVQPTSGVRCFANANLD